MVKKSRNRQMQESPTIQNGGDSAESCDQKKTCLSGNRCPHVQKAVHLASVKKVLRNGCLAAECPCCSKEGVKHEPREGGESDSLWLCLQCGHQGCGRTQNQHALKHFQVVHSDPHCLVVNTATWSIWCYHCEVELESEYRKKLHECVKYLKNLDCPSSSRVRSKSYSAFRIKENSLSDCSSLPLPLSDVTNVPHGVRSVPKKKIMLSLPRVRGLHNRGNTCFFNSVLQCLAQTPHFLELLQEMRQGGTKFCLPGGRGLLKTKPDEEEGDEELPPLEGTAAKWGSLTEALTSTLEELRLDDATAVNPQRLFNKLTTRWPQFGGGEQHDAHELLRHLLDEVRSEDLKRYWTAILDEYGLSRHDTSETVDVSVRARVRAYGKQAGERLLLPDPVFRGILVSTVECQDCLHSYQRTEPFYELSLPVTTNKPQPPVMRRKAGAEDSFDVCGNMTNETMSKHKMKKERRQQRKGRKRGQGQGQGTSCPSPPSPSLSPSPSPSMSPSRDRASEATGRAAGEPSGNTVESEQSDADVEDNVEQEVHLKIRSRSPESSVRLLEEGDGNQNKSPVCESRPYDVSEKNFTIEENGVSVTEHDVFGAIVDSDVQKTSNSSFQLMKDSLVGCKEIGELSVSVLLEPNSLSVLGSPISNTGSPNSVISDVNVDLLVSNHLPAGSWLSEENERPVSRIAFCNDDSALNSEQRSFAFNGEDLPSKQHPLTADSRALETESPLLNNKEQSTPPCNPVPAGSWSGEVCDRLFSRIAFCNDVELVPNSERSNSLPACDLNSAKCSPSCDKDMASSDQLSKEMASLSLEDCQSPSHWDTCSVHSAEDLKDAKPLLPVEVAMCNGVSCTSEREHMDDGDKSGTLAPKFHCADKECSIESCLNQFTMLELMTGSCKVICENCSERINKGRPGKQIATNSTKQYLISNPPAVLVLHLKRFELHQNVFRKTPRHVTFPMLLDIAPICNIKCRDLPTLHKGQTKVLYSLYGVIQHSGTLHGGHFSAYVKVRPPVKKDDLRWCFLPTSQTSEKLEDLTKDRSVPTEPLPGTWYHVSDSRVNEVNEDRVLQSQAYLLFYERVW